MSNKAPLGVVLFAALATYFSMPLAKKVKAGEPVDLADVSPAFISCLLALITAVTGATRRSATPHPAGVPATE